MRSTPPPADSFDLRFETRSGGAFEDLYYPGHIDPTGCLLTGSLHRSGFTGDYVGLTTR